MPTLHIDVSDDVAAAWSEPWPAIDDPTPDARPAT